MPLFVDFQAVAANKNPYGVILETPKGLLKTQNKNPYGVIYKTPYPFLKLHENQL